MKKFKNIVLGTILFSTLFAFHSYSVNALDSEPITDSKSLKSFTVPSLDANGAMLQQTKEQLGDVVKDSIVNIEDFSYDYPNVQIKGNVELDNIQKPFLIEGILKNSGEYDKNRIILVGKDVYNNFDVLNCSFYYSTEWLVPFNDKLPDWKNKSINTLYLLDKENRNITFCENIAEGSTLEKGTELINNQDQLSTADGSDINWMGKVLKVVDTKFEPSKISTRSQGNQNYSYVKNFTYLGAPHRDILNIEILITFDDNLVRGGSGNGNARIQCHGGSFTNLNTGAKTNSYSSVGGSMNTIMEISIEDLNTHGFESSQMSGYVGTTASVTNSISFGYGIPQVGLSTSLTWNPSSSGQSLSLYSSGYYNSVSSNKFTRSIQTTFGSGNKLHYSSHYFQTQFIIRDFNGSIGQNGKVTAWFKLPFYNSFDGTTYVERLGRTVRYNNR